MEKKKTLLCLVLTSLTMAACVNKPTKSSSASVSVPVNENWLDYDNSKKRTAEEDATTQATAARNSGKLANGYKDFSSIKTKEDWNDEAELIGILEDYALSTFAAGIPLIDNGGKVMYSDRLTPASETYILNYGYGVLNGTINAPMGADKEPIEAYRNYLHTWGTQMPEHFFPHNGEGSDVSDAAAYYCAAFYDIKLNPNKDGYVWYSSLANGAPEGLVGDANEGYTKFKIKLRDDAKWSTASTTYAKYNNTTITLADVENAFRSLLTQKYGLFRSSELFNSSFTVVGANQFYSQTATSLGTDDQWSKVGFSFDYENNEFTVETARKYTQKQFMIQMSSAIFSPLDKEFITELGGNDYEKGLQAYGTVSKGADGVLASGPYVLENVTSTYYAFKKNATYFDKDLYNIEGVKVAIVPGGNASAFPLFINGELDSCSIPSAQMATYKNDSRARSVPGATVWKLNVNALDQKQWNSRFGSNGYVNAGSDNSRTVNPMMSNLNFLNGLYYAVDRQELADTTGGNPSPSYFSGAYTVDEDNGIQYLDTAASKAVMAKRTDLDPDTPGDEAPFGYNLAYAKNYFKTAVEQEIAKGTIKANSEIKLQTVLVSPTIETTQVPLLRKYFETAFNSANTSGVTLKLEIEAPDFPGVYDQIAVGDYDLGYAAISGNTLDPLTMFDVLCSDNRTNFTLSQAYNTSVVDSRLKYKDEYYSFDALQSAANIGALVLNGEEVDPVTINKYSWNRDDFGFSVNLASDSASGMKTVLNGVSFYDGDSWEDGWHFDESAGYSGDLADIYDVATNTVKISKAAAETVDFNFADNDGIFLVLYYSYEDANGNRGTEAYKIIYVSFK